jgi:hypothetical protein
VLPRPARQQPEREHREQSGQHRGRRGTGCLRGEDLEVDAELDSAVRSGAAQHSIVCFRILSRVEGKDIKRKLRRVTKKAFEVWTFAAERPDSDNS